MTAFPYVASPDKIPTLFKKIGEMGIPKKFSNTTLKSLGFTSSNDSRLTLLWQIYSRRCFWPIGLLQCGHC